jgi:hypothetical protein
MIGLGSSLDFMACAYRTTPTKIDAVPATEMSRKFNAAAKAISPIPSADKMLATIILRFIMSASIIRRFASRSNT